MTDLRAGAVRLGLIQMRSGRVPAANRDTAVALVREAHAGGAVYVQTPEMTNIVEANREAQFAALAPEEDDLTLAALRQLARDLGLYLHIGSLAIKVSPEKAVNRGFLIAPSGDIAARYDKIHMFDVDLDGGESWRESSAYEPGTQATVVDLPGVRLGLAICYDLRFPQLFRAEALAGAEVLSVPAAFTRQTGEAHWHVLLRARAIENGAFVVAAAQGGRHEDGRETFGHSIIVDPWGRILAEAGHDEPGVITATIDTAEVEAARRKIPNLKNAREFAVASAGGEKIRGAAS